MPIETRAVPHLTLATARLLCDAAVVDAERREWQIAVAVVDAAGHLLAYLKMDDVQPGSEEIAIAKARTAARLRRPTKALEDGIVAGRHALISFTSMGYIVLEGGLPIEEGGRIVGAIGISGMTSPQDAEVARAALSALA